MKRLLKGLILILMFLSIVFIYCDKKSTDSNGSSDTTDFNAMIGTWLSQSATVDVKLVTNSNQTANDFLSEADGEIEVTGEYTADLKYLLDLSIENLRIIMISENMILSALLKPAYSTSMLSFTLSDFYEGVDYQVTSDGDTTYYFGDISDFTISETEAQVTANNAQFVSGSAQAKMNTNATANATVTLDGTITAGTITISADTPTSILPYPLPIPAAEIGTVTLNPDSTFNAEFTIEEFVDVDTTITGRWYVEDGKLYLGPPEGEDGDPLEFDYSLQGNNLTLEAEIGISEFLDDVDTEGLDVMELLEAFFGLDSGSLDDVVIDITIMMSKASGKANYNKTEKSPWFNDRYRNQAISRILHNMDSIVNK